MIKVILWDIDGTLLNFQEAEKKAIRTCFAMFQLGECTDEMLTRYSAINRKYWERLERGEITKQQVLEGRFEEFFKQEHIGQGQEGLIADFNAEYQIRLGDTICFNDNGYELVESLKGRMKQYAVTNGTQTAQRRKLEKSGLNKLFDGIFISDEIGIEKPGIGFFDYVREEIGEYEEDEIMIVGDSLTSDMQGGNNAGILCCWYNPGKQGNDKGLKIDHEIETLCQLEKILAQ